MSFGGLIKVIKFLNIIRKKNIFDTSSHFGFLDTVISFLTIKSAADEQGNTLILGRTFKSSTKLLSCLVEKYKLTKSEVILNQIIEVIKEEIIKREV
jgi:hypothetical protein